MLVSSAEARAEILAKLFASNRQYKTYASFEFVKGQQEPEVVRTCSNRAFGSYKPSHAYHARYVIALVVDWAAVPPEGLHQANVGRTGEPLTGEHSLD